jgi:hypothetical protein
VERDGAERIAAGSAADAQQILSMGWFADGIEGSMPQIPTGWEDSEMTAELLEL